MNILAEKLDETGYILDVSNVESDLIKALLYESSKGSEAVILNYQHISQRGVGARKFSNDCGPSVAVSCLHAAGYNNITVDDIAEAYLEPNAYMTIQQLMDVLRDYGIPRRFARPLTIGVIHTNIDRDRKPVVVLVYYPALSHQGADFKGDHYILVYGAAPNGDLYYMDPLSDGRRLLITNKELEHAMGSVKYSQPHQGVLL